MQLHITNSTVHFSMPPGIGIAGEAIRLDTVSATYIGDTPKPGEYWPGQGGHYICTQPALLGLPARHLIFGADEVEDLTFGPTADVPGARNQLDGRANTAALLTASGDHAAAKWASEYQADDHTDFHLPSRIDLLMAYVCTPSLFKTSGWYWSSTQHSRRNAFVQDFEDGSSLWHDKGNEPRVRACRWIHLTA